MACDKPRTLAVFSIWLGGFFVSVLPVKLLTCCAVTEPNKKARHFGWRHHQPGVLCVLDSWRTTFLNPEKFPFWKVLLLFDSNNTMFCFFFFLHLHGFFFFFFFTVAVQNLSNLSNQETHLSPQKINCYHLQHLPPIHRSVCSSVSAQLFWLFSTSGDIYFSSTAV